MIYRTCQDFGTFCDGMSVSRCDNDYNGSLKCISKIHKNSNSLKFEDCAVEIMMTNIGATK